MVLGGVQLFNAVDEANMEIKEDVLLTRFLNK